MSALPPFRPPRMNDDGFEWEYDPEEEIGQELCSFTKPRNYTDRVGLRARCVGCEHLRRTGRSVPRH